MEFAGALRQAVQASGLTLERIRHRLGRRGLTVSVATLSYWQRGRSRPRSRTVVVALEEILQVPPGTLTELLDDPAPTAAPPRGPAGRGGAGAGP
ncbi:helix-turn-helix domain-containing protein, partial [Actinomadura geliboluensis]